MTSKVELTISTKYIPDWGIVEAFRELFQNAIDNEITNPENKMEFTYKRGTITVSNKTSVLEIESLLLGQSTKQGDNNTIGKHGEGYKLAIMVLLRSGLEVNIYNYGKREIWTTRLVKSKRFNGELITTVFIEKQAVWRKVPSHNLIIEVNGISEEDYELIKRKNLNLQDNVECIVADSLGRLLTNKKEKGNIYVRGLYICNNDKLEYGYDLEPKLVNLDRDRKLVTDFDIKWNSSRIWRSIFESGKMREELSGMVSRGSCDVEYITNYPGLVENSLTELGDILANKFIKENGEDSVPVTNTDEMSSAVEYGLKPIIVNASMAEIISKSSYIKVKTFKPKSIRERFEDYLEKIEGKLSDGEVEEFRELIDKL